MVARENSSRHQVLGNCDYNFLRKVPKSWSSLIGCYQEGRARHCLSFTVFQLKWVINVVTVPDSLDR